MAATRPNVRRCSALLRPYLVRRPDRNLVVSYLCNPALLKARGGGCPTITGLRSTADSIILDASRRRIAARRLDHTPSSVAYQGKNQPGKRLPVATQPFGQCRTGGRRLVSSACR